MKCPKCQKSLSVPDKYLGRVVKCPNCKQPFKYGEMAEIVAPPIQKAPSGIDRETPDVEPENLDIEPRISVSRIKRGGRLQTAESWLDLFDWKFKKYLTPWIVRATWIIFLVLVGIWLALQLLGIVLFILSLVAPSVEGLGQQGNGGVPRFEPANRDPRSWATGIVIFAQIAMVGVILTSVLWVRVVLESIIVLFNIATSLDSIDRKTTAEPMSQLVAKSETSLGR